MARSQQQEPKKKQSRPVTSKQSAAPALPHDPEVTSRSVDVVGIVPEDVHVDPEITEGHAGYEESGGSGVKPPSP
jgi:hypothetical protein